MAQEGNFVVGQNSRITLAAATSDEANVRGLNQMTLPLGWSATFEKIEEFGVPVAIQVATGLEYSTISCSGNFTIKDPTQALLRKYSLNATKITDMRFYLDSCSYAGLDLISNPGGYYQCGSMSPPDGSKSGVYSFSADFAPSGASTLYENHRTGTDLVFIADLGTGASVTDSANLFVENGFVAGQVCYADYVDGLNPLALEIATVLPGTITFVLNSGDEQDVPDFTGIATTRLSSGEAMAFDDSAIVCA